MDVTQIEAKLHVLEITTLLLMQLSCKQAAMIGMLMDDQKPALTDLVECVNLSARLAALCDASPHIHPELAAVSRFS